MERPFAPHSFSVRRAPRSEPSGMIRYANDSQAVFSSKSFHHRILVTILTGFHCSETPASTRFLHVIFVTDAIQTFPANRFPVRFFVMSSRFGLDSGNQSPMIRFCGR